MSKHANLKSGNLSRVISAAKELDDKEKIEKERAKREGKHSELDDLPPGHPMRLMVEEAKKRFEKRSEEEKEQKETTKRRKARKAKSADKQAKEREAQQREAFVKHKKAAAELNKGIDDLAMNIERFGKVLDNNCKDLIGASRTKAVRIKRILLAAHRGLTTSKISAKRAE